MGHPAWQGAAPRRVMAEMLGTACGNGRKIAFRSPSPRSNSEGSVTGHSAVHAPQPVHFVGSTKRGCFLILTVKFPGCPSTRSTSLKVRSSMSLCRPISPSRGAMVHIAQSLLGKVLSSCAITPPMAGPRSAKYTLMPPLARSSAACIPPIPPPTTNAAPTGRGFVSSDDMADGLPGGRQLRGPLLDRLEVQSQAAIDHVRPVAERRLYHQHRRSDDHVHAVRDQSGVRQA